MRYTAIPGNPFARVRTDGERLVVRGSVSSNPPLLVGRDREQQELRALLDATLAGQGTLGLVSGEAGIGKTALVDDLVNHAREHDVLVLNGACYDLTTTPPYGPWVEIMRAYPDAGDSLPKLPDQLRQHGGMAEIGSQAQLFELTCAFFGSVTAGGPLLLVLEDLHWSDPASLELLHYLAYRIHDLGMLTVVTYRDDELTRQHQLFQLLPGIVRASEAARIELQRLDPDAIRELVTHYGLCNAETGRLVAYLEQRAGGNPFFITELLRALEADGVLRRDGDGARLGELDEGYLPAFVVQVIERRLARLDGEARRALEIAAVIGQEVALDLWESVGQLDQVVLDRVAGQAIETHIVRETADRQRVAFTHALVREALYDGVVPTRRRAWHREIGELLARVSSSDPTTAAHHFQQAGDDRAAEWFSRAGLQAFRAEAWITAAERFAVAARLLDDDETLLQERGWLLFFAAWLLRHSNEPHAIDMFDEAERISEFISDPVLSAYTRYARGARLCTRGDIHRGVQELEKAIDAIDALLANHGLPDTRRQATLVIQRLLPEAERADSSQDSTNDADAPRVNHPRSVLINWIAHTGRYRETATAGERYLAAMSAAFSDDYRRMPQIQSCLHGMGLSYAGLGQPENARRCFALDREVAFGNRDYAGVEQSIMSELHMTLIPYWADQPDERSQLVAEAVRAWDRCRGITITTAGEGPPSELQVDVLEGHWRKARQLATDHLSGAWIVHIQGGVVALGLLDRHQGKPDDAWRWVAKLLPRGPATEPGDCYFPHVITAIRLAASLTLDASDLTEARRWIETHARWLEWSGAVLWQAEHQLLVARFHQLGGEFRLARKHAERALALASEPRQPLALISAHRFLGQLDTAERRFNEAASHLQAALDLATRCQAPYVQALTLLALAELQVATSRYDEARRLLAEVRAICTPLDARPTLDRVDSIEQAITTQASSAPVYPDGLTAREVEVLRLIAAGRSNREMADLLYITTRTVERHIANIYLKIDAHNRVEAAAYAARHDLSAPPSP